MSPEQFASCLAGLGRGREPMVSGDAAKRGGGKVMTTSSFVSLFSETAEMELPVDS